MPRHTRRAAALVSLLATVALVSCSTGWAGLDVAGSPVTTDRALEQQLRTTGIDPETIRLLGEYDGTMAYSARRHPSENSRYIGSICFRVELEETGVAATTCGDKAPMLLGIDQRTFALSRTSPGPDWIEAAEWFWVRDAPLSSNDID